MEDVEIGVREPVRGEILLGGLAFTLSVRVRCLNRTGHPFGYRKCMPLLARLACRLFGLPAARATQSLDSGNCLDM